MRLSRLWIFAALAAQPAWAGENIWASRPTQAEIQATLPPQARAAGGRVILRCKASSTGALTDCAVAGETPGATGAGAALLPLAAKYRMRPSAVADAAPHGEVMIAESFFGADTQPGWRHRPTPEDLRGVWPVDAYRDGVEGKAVIDCLVATSGSLYDCVVTSDGPPGRGFGAAALALTPQFLMWPAKRNGQPVLGDVTIPIDFIGAGRSHDSTLASRLIVSPAMSWTHAPSMSDVAAAYPAKAREAKLGGFVSLNCDFSNEGRLKNCAVMREEPKGQGFAAAAKALTNLFQLDPADSPDVRLTHASVALPVVFDPGSVEAPARGKPVWTHLPDADALHAAFTVAKPAKVAGRAVLACRVGQGGQLADCAVSSETPVGAGLGRTALALQASFRLATWSYEGLPIVGGSIHAPIGFDFSDPHPDAAPPKP